ncbi:MAG: hypothetical protein D8H91_10160 [Alloprevotella sp.]|nr:MAG: hypothetical protein D8H91_10160 [Alloprevotella sp.]
MKRVAIMLAVALVASCSLKKKSVDTSVVKVDSAAVTATSKAKVERFVDTTTTTTGRVVVTEVEFATDSTAGTIEGIVFGVSGIEVAGVTGRPVRSIRQQVFESVQERKGESQESEEGEESKQSAYVRSESSRVSKVLAPAPDPYRWRYIFYLSLIGCGVVIYAKRTPVIGWLRRILAGLIKR